jgi:hypothetical protein
MAEYFAGMVTTNPICDTAALALSELSISNGMSLVPNPTSGEFKVVLDGPFISSYITIFDCLGNIVLKKFVKDFNEYLKDKDLSPVQRGKATGSSAYYKQDQEEDPDKIYGDVDLQTYRWGDGQSDDHRDGEGRRWGSQRRPRHLQSPVHGDGVTDQSRPDLECVGRREASPERA